MRAGTPGASSSGCCSAHPEVEIGALTAGSNAGERLGSLQPHLLPLADRVLAETSLETLAGHDVVFLALPHGQSAAIAEQLGPEVVVIDCGADFRLDRRGRVGAVLRRRRTPARGPTACLSSATTARGSTAPGGSPCPAATRRSPRSPSRRPSPPGSSTPPTSSWSPRAAPAAPARPPKPHLLGSEVMGNASAYGVGGVHRHTPEIVQNLGAAHPTTERPGQLHPAARADEPRHPRHLLGARPRRRPTRSARPTQAAYDDEPFVHLLPEGQWPQTQSVLGSNAVHLQVTVDEAAGRLVAVGAVDNLTKGTAGAAVQCMNLALGLPETTGLPLVGVAP